MELVILDPTGCANWDDRMRTIPGASVFHTAAWARVLCASYGYRPTYFTGTEEDDCKALFPLMDVRSRLTGARGVCLPFTDACAPYVNRADQFPALFQQVVAAGKARGWAHIDVRGGREHFGDAPPALVYYTHTLALTDDTAVAAGLTAATQRNIRKALRNGVHVTVDTTPDAMAQFCRLNYLTRKRHGLPPQPPRFFSNLHREVLEAGLGSIVRAHWEGETVAAAVFLHFQDHVIYKYGASDPARTQLRANNLVMWEAIRYYMARGYATLDLGKTEKSNAGLRRYKLGWGCREDNLTYYRYRLATECFVEDRARENGWHNALFARMPMPLLKLAGRVAYRHMG